MPHPITVTVTEPGLGREKFMQNEMLQYGFETFLLEYTEAERTKILKLHGHENIVDTPATLNATFELEYMCHSNGNCSNCNGVRCSAIYIPNPELQAWNDKHPITPCFDNLMQPLPIGEFRCVEVWFYYLDQDAYSDHDERRWVEYTESETYQGGYTEFRRHCLSQGYDTRRIYRQLPDEGETKAQAVQRIFSRSKGRKLSAEDFSPASTDGGKDEGETPVNIGVANGIDPCPFCGGKEGETVFLGYKDPRYIISCCDCNVRIEDDRKDKVQAKWNLRNGITFWDKQSWLKEHSTRPSSKEQELREALEKIKQVSLISSNGYSRQIFEIAEQALSPEPPKEK